MQSDDDAAAVPRRNDYGDGTFRRCIRVEAIGDRVEGELCDDFHHFRARIRHDGRRIVAVEGEGVRVPWTTCMGALGRLEELTGRALGPSLGAMLRDIDPRAHCTHLLDLACLAARHATRQVAGGRAVRRYDVALPERSGATVRVTLSRDGVPLLDWTLEGMRIRAAEPARYSDQKLTGRAFHRLVDDSPTEDEAEAALVLRRAYFIGLGRVYDFDRIERATGFAGVVGAACHTFRPGVAEEALRIVGSVRDFRDAPIRLPDA